MFKLLIVDDEEYAVQALCEKVAWAKAGIEEVFTAYDAEEAREILSQTAVDVIVCDIEMPGENGLGLLQSIREQSADTEVIFLTGHASFSYAQLALQLGSFSYLLKPVKYDQLLEVVREALAKLSQARELKQQHETYSKYYGLWQSQKPLLVERFWQDVLAQRIAPSPAKIAELMETYSIEFKPGSLLMPIMISIERWSKEFSIRDEEIVEYALRNAASEIIQSGRPGIVLQDGHGINLVLLYALQDRPVEREELMQQCRQYMEACSKYFYCQVSCYLADPTPIGDLTKVYYELLNMERNNIRSPGSVIWNEPGVRSTGTAMPIPWFSELAVFFETGKKEEFVRRLQDMFAMLREQPLLTVETLGAFYHALLNLVYNVFHRQGLSVQHLFSAKEFSDEAYATKNLEHLEAWALKVSTVGMDRLYPPQSDKLSVMEQIYAYVKEHLADDMTREDIASFVNFNPAYLSRLFKKESGISLFDYILQERVEKAKQLLADTGLKISEIAEMTGYGNFSHFTKMFKKVTGHTPQEYRKHARIED
ncbi:two-component system, response regulator YesN [Paenibacillus sp. UNCCL117]|uniref:response regulator n=1 Tax=unclassified Paenibacillus TaxID=185978 RepID=UPI0008899A06|nr:MULTISPECIES: response regulator [unclassified Paenibacillus]SDD40523.1 two-component system, response regulator YesN [Paenibacillus sp. cl123]SFW48073.1 two-component system, response regulator YesN [Paenibacillus sp. UNCCL117]